MRQLHFIAGLPRSGSTLLAAILRQNPEIEAGISSPVGGIFSAVQGMLGRKNEAAIFLTEAQKIKMLQAPFRAYYGGGRPIAFDTNRTWPGKISVLAALFPEAKMICCVRQVGWIMDSFERLIRSNPYDLSGIFGFESGGTVYSRVQALSDNMVGLALNSLRDAFYSEHADRLLLIEYQALCRDPGRIVRSIYKWLGLEPFDHDYEHVETPPLAEEFDRQLGTPGLHRVVGKVEWRARETILPPDLFNSFGTPFWRGQNPWNVPIVHCDENVTRISEAA